MHKGNDWKKMITHTILSNFIERLGFDYKHGNNLNILALKGLSLAGNHIIPNADKPDEFNDLFFFLINNEVDIYDGTVDPGRYYQDNPLNSRGCAHVAFTQHIYVPGYHNRKYKAFRAKDEKIWIYRAGDDNKFDPDDSIKQESNTGVNLHMKYGQGEKIGKSSAGCMVIDHTYNSHEYQYIISIRDQSESEEIPVTVWHGKDLLYYMANPLRFLPTLRFGCISPFVSELQCKLGLIQNDLFDSFMHHSICEFQQRNGLTIDGIVGDHTWEALNI